MPSLSFGKSLGTPVRPHRPLRTSPFLPILILHVPVLITVHSQFPTRFNTLCERIFAEGREAAGAPRLQRADSMTFYRERAQEEQQAASATSASFYPRGLTELIDRYWTTMSTTSSASGATEQKSTATQASPERKRPALGHLRLPAGTGTSAGLGKVVSFQEPKAEEEKEAPVRPTHDLSRLSLSRSC